MVKMKILKTILLLLFPVISLYSQEQPFSQLYLHHLPFLNPACTGQDYCTKFYLTDRHQWLGIAQAPNTQVIGIEHTILPNPYKASRKFGLSLEFRSDRNGAVKRSGGQAGYAFHTRLNKKKELFLSFGLNFSLMQHSINEGDANVEGDPVLGAGENAWLPDAAAGVYIYSPKFNAGFSATRLLPAEKNFYENSSSAFIPGNFFLFAGYNIRPRTGTFSLNPLLVFKLNQQMQRQIDLNLLATIGPSFQTGVSYRQDIDNLPGNNTGLQFLFRTSVKSLQITYVAEVSLNQTQSSHFGSHELGLIYKICYREKPQCPAFE
jgi:type IX secretion system PorP/SprF family membrane protein